MRYMHHSKVYSHGSIFQYKSIGQEITQVSHRYHKGNTPERYLTLTRYSSHYEHSERVVGH